MCCSARKPTSVRRSASDSASMFSGVTSKIICSFSTPKLIAEKLRLSMPRPSLTNLQADKFPLDNVGFPWSVAPIRTRRAHTVGGFHLAQQLRVVDYRQSLPLSIGGLDAPVAPGEVVHCRECSLR